MLNKQEAVIKHFEHQTFACLQPCMLMV